MYAKDMILMNKKGWREGGREESKSV